jgi:o-succinylbenzoate synthase
MSSKPKRVLLSNRILRFNFEAKTSRGGMKSHMAYYICIENEAGQVGIGEAAPLSGLSPDFNEVHPHSLMQVCNIVWQTPLPITEEEALHQAEILAKGYPSVRFALETAYLDLLHGGQKLVMENDFVRKSAPIPINGLIWMAEPEKMLAEGIEKFGQGYNCLKLKIGALKWKKELEVLKQLRQLAPSNKLTIRVDANGAFNEDNIWLVLDQLERLDVHSIEQPVKPGNHRLLDELCNFSPVPIALDEELIGEKPFIQFLDRYLPHYFVLKPTLLGGLAATKEWIDLAKKANIDWWITSALESNVGLNAICQFTYDHFLPNLPQGLGTGKLYKNNIDSPLVAEAGYVRYQNDLAWGNLPA